jgi:hypothetical protein
MHLHHRILLTGYALAFEETVSYVYYDQTVLDCTFFQENETETVTVQNYGYYATFTESVSLSEVKCTLIEGSS